MTKLNWDKAKRWEEPAYPHLPLKEYLEEHNKPHKAQPNLQHLYDWDIDKYNETKRKERALADQKERSYRGRQKAKAYYEWLNTPVFCEGCGKKRRGKDTHSQLCRDKKEAEKYGWHYGKKPPSSEAIKQGHIKKHVKYAWEKKLENGG